MHDAVKVPFGQSEINKIDVPGLIAMTDQKIVWLDVTMQIFHLMQHFNALQLKIKDTKMEQRD